MPVFDERTSDAPGKGVGPAGDQVPRFIEIAEGWPAVESPEGIDDPGPFCVWQRPSFVFARLEEVLRPPEAHSIEVFETEPDRIDLAMTTGGLGAFLMGRKTFASGEDLACQSGQSRHIGWRRRGEAVVHLVMGGKPDVPRPVAKGEAVGYPGRGLWVARLFTGICKSARLRSSLRTLGRKVIP